MQNKDSIPYIVFNDYGKSCEEFDYFEFIHLHESVSPNSPLLFKINSGIHRPQLSYTTHVQDADTVIRYRL